MKYFISVIAVTLASFHTTTHAAMVIPDGGIGGASNYAIQTPAPTSGSGSTGATTTAATVWGGVAGLNNTTGVSCTANAFCNTCTATSCTGGTAGEQAPLCACNMAAIHPALNLAINVTKNPDTNGVLKASLSGGSSSSTTAIWTGTNYAITIPWSGLCSNVTSTYGANANCLTNGPVNIILFDDKDGSGTPSSGEDQIPIAINVVYPLSNSTGAPDYNIYGQPTVDGIGTFKPYPGDERIYITELNTSGTFNNMAYGVLATSVRIFVSSQNMDNAVPGKTDFDPQDLNVNSNKELDHPFIDGVQNDKTYFVRIALVDQAKNVVQFFPDQASLDTNCTGATATAACIYAVTPEVVLGLLSKDFNCFVATAAYGSSLEPKLNVFRAFRNQLMLTKWGRPLVWKYYTYGPYAARAIADSPVLRVLTRGMLWPAYGFTWLSIKYGLGFAAGAYALLISILSSMMFITVRRLRARA